MPPRRVCEDYDSFLPYRALFGLVVIATTAIIFVAVIVYFIAVLTLEPARFEKPEQAKAQQR